LHVFNLTKMKKQIVYVLMALIYVNVYSQQHQSQSPEISFEKYVHDFGEVYKDGKTEYSFTFTNTGQEPLILSNVRSSCGCTVPDWPKNPILPGQSASITVKYNSGIVGDINRQVTVLSNAHNSPTSLRIAGKIIPQPEEILPIQLQQAQPIPRNN